MGQTKDPLYHRRSIRLKGYDYSEAGDYFVTIVTKDRESLFGEIIDGEMRLNEYGRIVNEEWERSASVRKEIEIEMDEFVVMPNHIHGIVTISPDTSDENVERTYGDGKGDQSVERAVRAYGDGKRDQAVDKVVRAYGDGKGDQSVDKAVRAYGHTPLPSKSGFRSPSKTLGSMVRGFKIAVTTRINTLRGTPGEPVWLRNYFEHIICTEKEYENIANYIHENPLNWGLKDEYYQ